MENAAINGTEEVARKTVSVVEAAVKKVWSILDAASEKQAPSKMLNPQAIKSIQGS